jgi:hypothetical protein
VPEHWIVDLDSRMIERWCPADERPELLGESLVWQPDPSAPPLVLDLPAYFSEVLGSDDPPLNAALPAG